MSSKEQFRDALKREKLIIIKQKEEIELQRNIISELKHQNSVLKIRLSWKKKWYQFWK